MNTELTAAQVGSYLWAKQAADRSARFHTRLLELAALTGKPYGVVRDQVAELAQAGRVDSLLVIDRLEYSHHYRAVQSTEVPPPRAADRRTVHVLGKPYHWAAGPLQRGGKLTLKPGESPW
jgi:hypothetical protein